MRGWVLVAIIVGALVVGFGGAAVYVYADSQADNGGSVPSATSAPQTSATPTRSDASSRQERLEEACFDSGVCNEETVDSVLAEAASDDERAKLRAIVRKNREQALRRAWSALVALESNMAEAARLQVGGPSYRDSPACYKNMERGRRLFPKLHKELRGLALTLPGVPDLRAVPTLAGDCWACADDRSWCEQAKGRIAQARKGLESAGANKLAETQETE